MIRFLKIGLDLNSFSASSRFVTCEIVITSFAKSDRDCSFTVNSGASRMDWVDSTHSSSLI